MLLVKAPRPSIAAFTVPGIPLLVGMKSPPGVGAVRPDRRNASSPFEKPPVKPSNDLAIFWVNAGNWALKPESIAVEASGAKKANCWKEKARPAAAFRRLVMLVTSRPANEVVTPATTTESAPSLSISVVAAAGLPGGSTTVVVPPPPGTIGSPGPGIADPPGAR